ncbi:MAG TPA: two-component regulator propeller domain-containing protein [Thermoanaerobaculia bacterium]|nr:two-component regulator propeller domain-containing protein [Thermoanaerobaculia bacterium]
MVFSRRDPTAGSPSGRRLACLLWLVVAAPAHAERLPIRTFTTLDGLVHDGVRAVTQDARGFLWFATNGGLSRFDGYGFKNYGKSDGLPDVLVRAVLESKDGRLWLGTERGLCEFDHRPAVARGQLCQSFRLGPKSVRALFEDGDRNLWVGTANGLFVSDLKARETVFREQELYPPTRASRSVGVNSIRADGRGGLWLATWDGVMRVLKNRQVLRYPAGAAGEQEQRVFDILPDPSGRLWVGDAVRGLFVWQTPEDSKPPPAGWSLAGAARRGNSTVDGRISLPRSPGEVCLLTSRDGLSNEFVRQGLLRTSNGNIWIGTVSGLTRFDGVRLRAFRVAAGLSDPAAQPCLEDREGNLWLGSANGGAMRLAGEGFATYTEADGLRGLNVGSILEGRDGALYVQGTTPELRDLIQRFDGERFTAVAPRLPRGSVTAGQLWQSGLQDRKGAWWLPTAFGLARYAPVARLEDLAHAPLVESYTPERGLGGRDVSTLYEDQQGDVWIGTWGPGFLTRWVRKTGQLQRFGAAEGVPATAPTAFVEDRGRTLWIAFASGELGRFRGNRVELLPFAPPVGSRFINPRGQTYAIVSLYLDRRGDLWVATAGAGAQRIEDPTRPTVRLRTFTTADGLSDDRVTCIAEDPRGDLYFGTLKGVDRMDPGTGRFRHYTALDGLPSGIIQPALRDRHGELWFGSTHGLARFLPSAPRAPAPPTVLITALLAGGNTRAVSERGVQRVSQLSLPADHGDIQIEYVGLSFAPGERLRYRYRLEGADRDWNPPTEGRRINYARLAAGSYRFVVRALSAEGGVNAPTASVAFTVRPPLWRRSWIQLLAVAMAAGLALSLHRTRVARLVAVARVRGRVAADLHDDLGASLSEIAIQSELLKQRLGNRQDDVANVLAQIADTSRSLIDVVSDTVWAVDPRNDDLQGLATRLRHFASGVLEPKGVRFELESEEGAAAVAVAPEQRRQLYLILKEAVHNIARHAAAGHAHLRLAVRDGDLLAELRDDGRGFDRECADGGEATGNGLRNMRQRARELGGELLIDARPGHGVGLTLRVPLGGGRRKQ